MSVFTDLFLPQWLKIILLQIFLNIKGQTLAFKIIEIEPSENRLILSHKAVVEAEKNRKKKNYFLLYMTGDVVEGKVARLTDSAHSLI